MNPPRVSPRAQCDNCPSCEEVSPMTVTLPRVANLALLLLAAVVGSPLGRAPAVEKPAVPAKSVAEDAAPPGKIEYNRDIRPILAENCFPCHGQHSAARK